MSITTRRTDLSRRTFILAGAAGALAARSTLSRAHAQPTAGNLNFRVTGKQSPSVIFVHGFGCALEDWDAQVKALSPKFRCAALDLPGHGASAKPANGSIASMAAAVNQVKEGVGRGRKVLVLQSTCFNSEFKRVPLQPGKTTPWMDAIAVSVPKSQAKVVPNAGHFTMIDAAQRVSEEIGKFAAAAAKGRRQ
jgi:pimeloyl-ACP methyl ester carboxylesterase